jgi:hypothetical protein
MQQVTQLKDLGNTVMHFCGKNIEEVFEAAANFAKARGATAQRYFLQKPFGGSKLVNIIADYVK